MSKIFISYRREDSELYVGRLYCYLLNYFKREDIFFDFSSISYGEDFEMRIRKALNECDALIAVIGEKWLTIKDKDGYRRLDRANDVLRAEIRYALEKQKFILPILVDHASMPQANELPIDLQGLSKLQAFQIDRSNFELSIQRIVETLTKRIKIVNIRHDKQDAIQRLLYQMYGFTDTNLAANRLGKVEGAQLRRMRSKIVSMFNEKNEFWYLLLCILFGLLVYAVSSANPSPDWLGLLISFGALGFSAFWCYRILQNIFDINEVQVIEGGLRHLGKDLIEVNGKQFRALNSIETAFEKSPIPFPFRAYYMKPDALSPILLSLEPVDDGH